MVEIESIWTEKYRPQDFPEIVGQKETVKRVKAFVKQQNMPHLMFAGPAGTGKTTLALIIAKKLFKEAWRSNFLELNASDERGIDVIRNKVKDFARTRAIGGDVPFKIIYLDESDALTPEAQQALRRTMENFTRTCRFILSCNYSSKIIEPIQSRCAIFRFRPLDAEEMKTLLENIASKEALKVSNEAENALVGVSEGDGRRLTNLMQSCAASSKEITEELVYSVAAIARPKEIDNILLLASEGKFGRAKVLLLDVMLNYGLSGLDIIRQIQKQAESLKIDDRKKLGIIEKCGETEFRMVEGSDEFIQLESLLSSIALLCQEKTS